MRRNEEQGNLRLDRVLASQPELGPSIPDGGYGWIIVCASFIIQILIPSILASYGIFMLFSGLESTNFSDNPYLWDNSFLPTPVLFIAFWSLSDPWSRKIVTSSTWPRLVLLCGICLICSGILFQWIAFTHHTMAGYVMAGICTGFGASLTTTQNDIIIRQYFKLKLPLVVNFLACAYSTGFIVTPIMLGFIIIKHGIQRGLLIYQAIILQLIVVILFFKKPLYLKAQRRPYELIQNVSEDDEMIFAKDASTELHSKPTNNAVQPSTSSENRVDDMQDNTKKLPNLLMESFAEEFAQDLGHRNQLETEPKPIYIEVQQKTQNTTYTFDNSPITVADDNQANLFVAPDRVTSYSLKNEISFLWKLSFYKSLLMLVTIKYSALVYWILFPTYVYIELTELKVQQTTFIVGCIGLGSLFIGMFSSFLPTYGNKRQTTVAAFCFLGAIGYFVISDVGTEGWLLFGALLVTVSIAVFHVLNASVIKYILGNDSDKAYTVLNTLVGLCVLAILAGNASYRSCFRNVSILQFITGSLLLTSYIYKKIKHLYQ